MGWEVSPTASFTWQSKAPLRCRFFNWLALKNICWTSDRLARRGLPHQTSCPMCNQQQETMHHLMLECSFAKQIWLAMSRLTNTVEFQPRQDEPLEQWCIRQYGASTNRKAHRAKCLLVMWIIWKQRNDVVFNGAVPSQACIKEKIREECDRWKLAKLFRSSFFVFPKPVATPWQLGE